MNTPTQQMAGCLFGMALGDAIAAPTEFLNVEGILKRFPPHGPQELPHPARVTDDTQMALAVGEALVQVKPPYTAATLYEPLRDAFVEWYRSPDNNRAPGMTCMTSIERIMAGQTWLEATNTGSKGCGANMRVMPVGVLHVDDKTRAGLAQFQAALTHAHPTALAASDLTAFTIWRLIQGSDPTTLLGELYEYAQSQRSIYHTAWLGDLWQRSYLDKASPDSYIERGWDECFAILERLEEAIEIMDRESDPCLATGEGWIAEEAFATAFLCFAMYPHDPVAAIRRAAVTKGDSDSIACIAGAFAGAYNGLEKWPEAWLARIEYHDRIQNLVEKLG